MSEVPGPLTFGSAHGVKCRCSIYVPWAHSVRRECCGKTDTKFCEFTKAPKGAAWDPASVLVACRGVRRSEEHIQRLIAIRLQAQAPDRGKCPFCDVDPRSTPGPPVGVVHDGSWTLLDLRGTRKWTLFSWCWHISSPCTHFYCFLLYIYIYIHSVLQSWHCEDPWQAGVLRDPWPR